MMDNNYVMKNLPALIDRITTVSLNNSDKSLNELVRKLQTHYHKKTCWRFQKCRFSFPRLPSDETIIATPLPESMDKEERKVKIATAKKILTAVKKALEDNEDNIKKQKLDNVSIKEFIENLGLNYDEYKNALKIAEKGYVIINKREVNEVYVNNYNLRFIKMWNANIDCTFVLSKYEVLTYISDYLTKDKSKMSSVLQGAMSLKSNATYKDQLNYIKQVYLTAREVSLSEAVYRILPELSLKMSNLSTIFVCTGLPATLKFQI